MTLYFDLTLGRFVSAPGYRDRVRSVEFKRGDAAQIVVGFYRGTTQELLAGTPQLTLALKESGKYDADPLVSESSWVLGTGGAMDYSCTPNFNTVALNTLLASGDLDDTNDVAKVTTMLELTWSEDGGSTWSSSDTLSAIVHNDVIKGTEGTPLPAADPETWLYARTAALTGTFADPNGNVTALFDGQWYRRSDSSTGPWWQWVEVTGTWIPRFTDAGEPIFYNLTLAAYRKATLDGADGSETLTFTDI